MRRNLALVLAVAWIASSSPGCSYLHSRSQHPDPFARSPQARPAGKEPANNWPSSIAPGSRPSSEVIQAAQESSPGRGDSISSASASGRGRSLIEDDSPFPDDEPAPVTNTATSRTNERSAGPPAPRPKSGAAMDHSPDYSWVQGKLEYSAFGGGLWKVRYAPLSVDDEHGGSVILQSPPDSDQFEPGNLVYVEGEIIPNKQLRALRSPLYRVQRIRQVEE